MLSAAVPAEHLLLDEERLYYDKVKSSYSTIEFYLEYMLPQVENYNVFYICGADSYSDIDNWDNKNSVTKFKGKVNFLVFNKERLSSTKIRQSIKRDQCGFWKTRVPCSVYDYIRQNRLYKE